jgi:hypothetical protein
MKPVNTNKAPAAIKKSANAILAIPIDEREHRALCATLPPTTLQAIHKRTL